MAKFKFIKDFSVTAYQLQDGKSYTPIDKQFKKGDIIEGGNDPRIQSVVALPYLQTTLEGKMPNWENGDEFVCEIPFAVVKEVSADTPTDEIDDPLTNTQKWMVVIGVTAVAYYILYKVNKN